MKPITNLLIISLILIFVGCAQKPVEKVITKTESDITEIDLKEHIKFLADDERTGRYPGSKGSQEAVKYIVDNFKSFGLDPAGTKGYLQEFDFTTGIKTEGPNSLSIEGEKFKFKTDFIPLEYSASGKTSGEAVFAGYGFVIDDTISWNDYEAIDAEGKWVVILRGGPGGDHPHSEFADHIPPRKKALQARDQLAAGVLFVNQNETDELITLKHSPNSTTVGIPVININRRTANKLLNNNLKRLQTSLNNYQKPQSFEMDKQIDAEVNLMTEKIAVPNVLGMIPGNDPNLKNEYIVIGAHFDHLGFGGTGTGSLSPESNAIHNGADDNASGTAGVLEIAEKLSANRNILKRSVLFMAYNAEESGLLGSKYFVNNPTIDLSKITVMINMDMIGRMSEKKLTIGGTGTAPQFEAILSNANKASNLTLRMSPEGYGPSDHASFYINNIPVLFFFTGTHSDYHKPSDDWENINFGGEKQILDLVYNVIIQLDTLSQRPEFTEAGPKEATQTRRSFKVSLGVIPSYGSDAVGLEIDGAKKEGPAGKAGMIKGDIITAIDGKAVKNIYDYMYRLAELKPGQTIEVKVRRGEKNITLTLNL